MRTKTRARAKEVWARAGTPRLVAVALAACGLATASTVAAHGVVPQGSTFNGYTTQGTVTQSTTTNYAKLGYDTNYAVEDNEWGIPSNGQGGATAFLETINGASAFGWTYDVTNGTGVAIFPEVGYGWTPNGNASWGGTPTIPQLSSNPTIVGTFDITSQHSTNSTWDLAYDIWIMSSAQPSSTTGGYELMIWLDHDNQGPWSTMGDQGLVTIGGVSYQRYTNAGAADWTCLTYVNQGAGLYQSSNFNISDVINDAASKFGISSGFYVAAIEFGNEVVTGTGITEISDWTITVNGAQASDGGAPTSSADGGASGDAGPSANDGGTLPGEDASVPTTLADASFSSDDASTETSASTPDAASGSADSGSPGASSGCTMSRGAKGPKGSNEGLGLTTLGLLFAFVARARARERARRT